MQTETEHDRIIRHRKMRQNFGDMIRQRMDEALAGHRYDPFRGAVTFSPGESQKRFRVYGALYQLHLYSLPMPGFAADAVWLADFPDASE